MQKSLPNALVYDLTANDKSVNLLAVIVAVAYHTVIDFITLKQALKDRAQLDEIGGPEYLSDLFLFESTSSATRL